MSEAEEYERPAPLAPPPEWLKRSALPPVRVVLNAPGFEAEEHDKRLRESRERRLQAQAEAYREELHRGRELAEATQFRVAPVTDWCLDRIDNLCNRISRVLVWLKGNA